jgi:phosphoribosylpyrophosphate synthetase
MFKFVSKGDSRLNESVLFYNGQKICTVYAGVYADGEIQVQIEDGNNRLMKEWEDYLEEHD